ncbi:MAG: NAD-dependent succinate-semialdehyde dehydrogenase [Balneolaceae bacterium]
MKTVNPATGQLIKEYANTSFENVEGIIFRANKAQSFWKKKSIATRTPYLQKMADILKGKKKELAELMALEMGKPLNQGIREIEKCAWVCEFYADNAEKFLSNQKVETDARRSYVAFNPLGIVLSIMPWNFPFWQFFRFSAPALMAGNGVILKHSENTTGCALKIEEIVQESGISSDLVSTILVPNDEMKPIIQHNGIAAVTLTGSTRAGKQVASEAGEALKKTVLELGGSDPYIILKDADIMLAAEKCATSRLVNSGQSCVAAKRFIVEEEVYDEFLEAFTSILKSKKVGNPFDEDTDVGPMAREDLRDGLHEQVEKSIELGARVILGCEKPDIDGSYYPVSILADVKKGMPAYEEELFGPVAAIIKAKDEKESIQIANDSIYGLGAGIFSKDIEKAERIAEEELEAGCCFVNDFVKSDPRLPFGGVKQSGYGRELGAVGIREFVNTKTVWVG